MTDTLADTFGDTCISFQFWCEIEKSIFVQLGDVCHTAFYNNDYLSSMRAAF